MGPLLKFFYRPTAAYRELPEDRIVYWYAVFPVLSFLISGGFRMPPIAALLGGCLAYVVLAGVYSGLAFVILRFTKRYITFPRLVNIFFLSMVLLVIMHAIDSVAGEIIMDTFVSNPEKAISNKVVKGIQALTWTISMLMFVSWGAGAYFASVPIDKPNE